MKKAILLPTLLTLFLLPAFPASCKVEEMSTLPELTKPYAGVYECDALTLGGEDQFEKFDHVYLALFYDGSFCLSYQSKAGGRGSYNGKYTVSKEGDVITLRAGDKTKRASYSFPIHKGTIEMDYNLGGRLLHATFRMP